MTSGQFVMFLAAAFWVLLHVGLAGSPLRWRLVGAIGENGFRGLFSLLSAVGLFFLIWAYGQARSPDHFYGLWVADRWTYFIPIVIMPFAFLLLVAALTPRNVTLAGADMVARGEVEPRGIFRITRHPMLWAFALWAAAHIPPNGDLGSLQLFLAVLIVSVAGMFSIDRKRARQQPATWPAYAAATSVLPFGAILAGRNRLALSELGWGRIALAALAFLLVWMWHGALIGVSALPG
ncbi:MAG: hypothetical protein KIT81_06390 [Alphaproteobacteria bacterium]|nr:hypothetical protein [Alphaproteobacteria bacterium]